MVDRKVELNAYESVDLIYAKDLANGIALATHTSPLAHQVYNLGSGTLITVEDADEALRKIFPGINLSRGKLTPARADGYHAGTHGDRFQSGVQIGSGLE